MTTKKTTPDGLGIAAAIKRRSVLQGMGGIAAAALGAAVVGADAVAQPSPASQTPNQATEPLASQETGYRLTDHIRAYYRTTRL